MPVFSGPSSRTSESTWSCPSLLQLNLTSAHERLSAQPVASNVANCGERTLSIRLFLCLFSCAHALPCHHCGIFISNYVAKLRPITTFRVPLPPLPHLPPIDQHSSWSQKRLLLMRPPLGCVCVCRRGMVGKGEIYGLERSSLESDVDPHARLCTH